MKEQQNHEPAWPQMLFLVVFEPQRSWATSKWFLKRARHLSNFRRLSSLRNFNSQLFGRNNAEEIHAYAPKNKYPGCVFPRLKYASACALDVRRPKILLQCMMWTCLQNVVAFFKINQFERGKHRRKSEILEQEHYMLCRFSVDAVCKGCRVWLDT